jgi:ATP-binding cassette, subfamily C (CFTR/MRP), member 1
LLSVHHGRGLTAGASSAHASGSATPTTTTDTVIETPSPPAEKLEEAEFDAEEKDAADKPRKVFERAKLLPISYTHAPGAPDLNKTPDQNKEHSEQGKVQWKVYTSYIKAASRVGFALFIILILVAQTFSIGANVTLMMWGNAGAAASVGRYIAIYGICVALSAGASALSSLALWVYCTLRSARELHDSMLVAVMRAPLSFFEITPTGR